MTVLDKSIEPKEFPIIPAATAIETFRDSGYRDTAAALSELIDNSIEAKADNVRVIAFEEPIAIGNRTVNRVSKIAIYDDGIGMSPDVLQLSLQFGVGTRMNTRDGMGRFGIGLPNASVSQCCRVEIYSWQKGICHFTYLDIEEIKKEKKQDANLVTACEMPIDYLKQLDIEYNKDSGTLILWKQCDRLSMARSSTLFNSMEKALCRVYRHFLDDDTTYGRKVSIKLIKRGGGDDDTRELRANDPLYLLTPNNVPGYENEKTNKPWGEPIIIPVPYNSEGKTSPVEIRFSIAKTEFHSKERGTGKIGQKHYAHNTGISFVRACREIDFGDFYFFNSRQETQRWWGCEIRFSPVLDELFGVTNNKQSVRGIRFFDEKEYKELHGKDWQKNLEEDRKEDLQLNLRCLLSQAFSNNHATIMKTIDDRHKGEKNESLRGGTKKSVDIVNDELKESKVETKSQKEGNSKTDEQKTAEWLQKLQEGNSNISEQEAIELAEEKKELKMEIEFVSFPGEQFYTLQTVGSTPILQINVSHPFYTELYKPLADDSGRFSESIELLLMAYVRTQEELYSYDDEFDRINSSWGRYVRDFLKAQKNAG